MKIDLPITIIFDSQGTDHNSILRAAGKLVCTIRYETEGDGTDAKLYQAYPPPDEDNHPGWESAAALLAVIPSEVDKRVNRRAERSPYDYMVGTEQERTIAQEEADEAAAQDGQFGAGA